MSLDSEVSWSTAQHPDDEDKKKKKKKKRQRQRRDPFKVKLAHGVGECEEEAEMRCVKRRRQRCRGGDPWIR